MPFFWTLTWALDLGLSEGKQETRKEETIKMGRKRLGFIFSSEKEPARFRRDNGAGMATGLTRRMALSHL
jgi:hypothetical protein